MTSPGPAVLAALALLVAAAPAPARAHHGVAAVSLAGAEGPGAALETTSALQLPAGTVYLLAKTELVPFQRRAIAEPENKDHSLFSTLAVGYGLTPWLAAYVFQPFAVKAQDAVGTSAGPGDTNLMLVLGLKWDEGLRLVPEKESLDELEDWRFSLWASTTVPGGSVSRRDDRGEYFEPDMQSGFGAPSPALGVAVLKALSPVLTFQADASYQHFLEHRYDFTRYQFGSEARAGAALVWRAWNDGRRRLDLAGELLGLHLNPDREENGAGELERLRASGGTILYAAAGLRFTGGAFSAALGARRAVAKRLEEEPEQQGSEGLEAVRATLSLSWSTGL